ncbi:MAG TPA: hypothetical protein PKN36_10925, partial [bacterium]|nr:hypothetical protein [bacterium]
EGPGRFAVKRTGWYVTDEREKLARAETWIYFSAGTPYVKITHALILTEDTNKVWFKDYGLQFKIPARPSTVYCAVGEEREARKLANGEDEIFLLQSEYPHFAEREYKAMIGSSSGGRDKIIEEFDTAGDWAHGDYGNFGVTVVMPWLSERFPKEISFGERGARAVLWSGRSGKELDFRAKTLVKEYWQAWAEKAPGSPGKEKLSAMERNAQGSARTHDIWFLPRAGSYDGETVRKTAMAGARTPLAMAEPQWLCKTEAMGIPMLHRDTDRFPREEAMISEYWDRFILPLKLFPTNGFLMWGCPSFFQYGTVDKKIMANFYLLVLNDPYGVRREPWRHYARSGERRLYDTGHMFSRYTGDWMMAHWDVPESRKERGAFILPQTRENRMLPFIWGDYTDKTYMISGDIGHWLLEYYLTGDERSFSLVEMVKDSFRERVKLNMDKKNYYKYPYPILLLRTLLTLSLTGWDSEFASKNRELAHSLVDLNSQNGMDINSQGGYGPMYKDHRSSHNLAEYYLETGDETVKEAFLKLVDQRYRFDRRLGLVSNKNYDAFTYSIAYWITGEERYRTAVEQTLRSALHASEKHPLSKLLARSPKNPLEWNNYPHHDVLTVTDFHNPFIGMPTAMKLLSEKGWSGKSTPLAARKKIMGGKFLFSHKEGRETRISISFSSRRQETAFEVCPYPETSGRNAVKNVKVEKEQIMSMGKYFLDRPEEYAADEKSFHSYITMPADAPTGLYLIYPDGNEPFTVLDSTSEKAAFYCPEGFWSLSGGSLSYGRSSEGIPMFFRVSEGLKELRIFMGRPAIVKRPDGSVAVEISDNNIGNQAIPVEGKSGIWSIEPHIYSYRGLSTPAFFRLLNVEPLIAFGSPNNLPEDTTGKPENLFMPLAEPAEAMEFVQGISGKALRLSKNRTLAFPAGPAVKDGGYTFFPGNTGTLEFWFRAGRSTYDTPLGLYQYVDTPFLNGPHIVFNHRYRARGHERVIYSTVQVELLERNNGLSNTGFQGEHYFKAGEWTHIAY